MKITQLKCECGKTRGELEVHPWSTSRTICNCDDCQTYARFLKNDRILDPYGGTDILPAAPADLKITSGIENLKCARLSPKGLYRWYAGCCDTPVANSPPNPAMPYVGIVHTFWDATPEQADQWLGPVFARIQARYAKGKPPGRVYDKIGLRPILRILGFLAIATLKRRAEPSPFFKDAQPVVEPYILSKQERQANRPPGTASDT